MVFSEFSRLLLFAILFQLLPDPIVRNEYRPRARRDILRCSFFRLLKEGIATAAAAAAAASDLQNLHHNGEEVFSV
jgi:hypothetical protein